MRTALAVLTLVAGSLAGVVGAVAPAHANSCSTPNLSGGFVITSLHAEGMSCHDARELAPNVVPRGELSHYECTRRHHAHRTATTCVRHGSHGHQYFTVVFHAD